MRVSDADTASGRLWLVGTARISGVHAVRAEGQASHLRSLIDEVRFNQKPLAFGGGVVAGPGPGDLDVVFGTPRSGADDRVRYRLLGVDTEWKEAGKSREIHYPGLAPGRYELDFQEADSGTLRGSAVETLPIMVTTPAGGTLRLRMLTIFSLLVLILILYKLRVGRLQRHNRKLQETVSQTKAELTQTAKSAGDAQEALKEQALKDGLTGLWNRRATFAMLERETYRAQRDRFPVILLMIDLDHFKSINDTWGHLTGDEVLRETAARLVEAMRPYDFAGRYGGEEFLVVLPSCSPENGLQRAEQFRRAIAETPFVTGTGSLAVTCSLGVAVYDDVMPTEDLIHLADEALYRAKRLGRNCVCTGKQRAFAACR
ncbi:MAG: diguanylate cyclase [Acidobacteriota bacterium]